MATYLCNDGNAELEIEADSAEEAAQEYVNGGSWEDEPKTSWVTVYVEEIEGKDEDGERILGDHVQYTIEIEPTEPRKMAECGHEWESPHSVVGGLRENPGVRGHGGGVIITEVCRHCGGYRITDTWAQNPQTGEQGLRSVEYREADDDSEEWIRSQEEEQA